MIFRVKSALGLRGSDLDEFLVQLVQGQYCSGSVGFWVGWVLGQLGSGSVRFRVGGFWVGWVLGWRVLGQSGPGCKPT